MPAPSVPQNLTATYASGKINLAWGVVPPPPYYGDYWCIDRRINGGSWSVSWKYQDWSKQYYADTDVGQDGTFYEYRVRVYYQGSYSAYCSTAGAVTPLPAPSQMDGSAVSIFECDLTFKGNSQNQTGYKLYMDGSLIYTGANQYYNKTGLQEGSTHSYYVIAYNSNTNSPHSNTVQITQEARPNAPSNLVVTAISTSVISGSFQDNSSDETGFKVYGSNDGSSWTLIKTLGKNVTTFTETGLASNQTRWYRVCAYSGAGNSSYCAVASATTFAAISQPTNLQIFPISGTVADVIFQDNSTLEDGHKVEIATGTSLPEAILDGGFEVWTSPTVLTNWLCYPLGTSTINRESGSVHSGVYSMRLDIDAGNDYAVVAQNVTMTPSGAYVFSIWYKTAAGKTAGVRIRDSGLHVRLKSDGSWIADDSGGIVLPTATTWTQFTFAFTAHASYSSYSIFCGHNTVYGSTAASSSIYMDDFSLCGAGFSVNTTTAPNQDAVRLTGLTAGTAYSCRVRAYQGAQYSIYSSIVSFTTLAVPAQVTGLTVSVTQDTWVTLTWNKIAGVTGYQIWNNLSALLYEVWGDDITSLKIMGLSPSTLYNWCVLAYNGAGVGAASSYVSPTTLATYARSALETLLRDNVDEMSFLLEMSPKLTLLGWTLTGGKTYTYQLPVDPIDRGISFYALYANGVSYTSVSSITATEATASTFFHDYYNNMVYIHTAGGDDPINYFVEGAFWLYFCSYRSKKNSQPMAFNGNNYLDYFQASDVPVVSQSVSELWEGSTAASSGSIKLGNPQLGPNGPFYWDGRYDRYTWEKRPLFIKMGGPGFTYAQYDYYASGLIQKVDCGDMDIIFNFIDAREDLVCKVPPNIFDSTTYPNADPNIIGKPIPFLLGTIPAGSYFVPPCVDTTRGRYKLNDGRIKGSETIYLNSTLLTINTDYFLDYQRGQFTLSKAVLAALLNTDKLTVLFSGQVNSADESYENGAEQFHYLMNNWLGLANSELDTDSIYYAKGQCTQAVCIGLAGEKQTTDIISLIEHSLQAYAFQAASSKIGLKVPNTSAPTSAPLVQDFMIIPYTRRCTKDSTRACSVIRVYYNQDFSKDNIYQIASLARTQDVWQKRATDSMPQFYTGLTTAADAQSCVNAINDALNRKPITFVCSQILFYAQPGDVIPLTQGRYLNAAGMVDNLPVMVLSVNKDAANRQTTITGVALE